MDVVCTSCQQEYDVESSKVWWDENGFGYSTKLSRCPKCGHINIIMYIEDEWIKEGLLND